MSNFKKYVKTFAIAYKIIYLKAFTHLHQGWWHCNFYTGISIDSKTVGGTVPVVWGKERLFLPLLRYLTIAYSSFFAFR